MIVGILRNLNFHQLLLLGKLFLKNPRYAVPTLLATKNSMRIATKEYGEKHHLDNKANAFRHALWNLLILRSCLKWNSNLEKAMKWTKTITDWHEEFSPNPALEKVMDLHNNQIGRNLYAETKNLTQDAMVKFLKDKASKAKRIFNVEDCENYKSEMIFIED